MISVRCTFGTRRGISMRWLGRGVALGVAWWGLLRSGRRGAVAGSIMHGAAAPGGGGEGVGGSICRPIRLCAGRCEQLGVSLGLVVSRSCWRLCSIA